MIQISLKYIPIHIQNWALQSDYEQGYYPTMASCFTESYSK